MTGRHTTALTQISIAEDDTRQALLRLAEDLARGGIDRHAVLFDFSGIPEIKNPLFFRAIVRFIEERTGGRPLEATPVAQNCVVVLTDAETAQAVTGQMRKFANFLRYQRHGTFQISSFDLRRDHRQFVDVCRKLMEKRPVPRPDRTTRIREGAPPSMEVLDNFISVGRILGQADISMLLRNQDVWFFPVDAAPVTLCREFWLSIDAVEALMDMPMAADSWLFDRMTQIGDHRVLNHMQHVGRPFPLPYSINLHLATIFSSDFRHFAASLRSTRLQQGNRRCDLIVELPAQECMAYPDIFAAAVDLLHSWKISIAIDRLDWQDLQSLPASFANSVDYLKVPWSSVAEQMAQVSGSDDAEEMIGLLERIGSSKVILTRCDPVDAVERGLRLGIRRFQGRGVNRFLLNGAAVERVLGQTAAAPVIKAIHSRPRIIRRPMEHALS